MKYTKGDKVEIIHRESFSTSQKKEVEKLPFASKVVTINRWNSTSHNFGKTYYSYYMEEIKELWKEEDLRTPPPPTPIDNRFEILDL